MRFFFYFYYAGAVPDEKFPVMVWFHPGDFHWGSPAFWDASVLAARHKVFKKKIVLSLKRQVVATQAVAHHTVRYYAQYTLRCTYIYQTLNARQRRR